jgi:hypothetical protein
LRTLNEFRGDEGHDGEDAEGAQHHERFENPVSDSGIASAKQVATDGRLLLRQRACGRLRRNRIGFRLRLGMGDTNLGHSGVHKGQATEEL